MANSRSSAGSVKQTFDTFELLENVLLHLPLQDLIRMQPLCHAVKSVTTEPPALRKKLFLRPDPCVNKPVWYRGCNNNTLAGQAANDYIASARATQVSPVVFTTAVCNPLILRSCHGRTKRLRIHLDSTHQISTEYSTDLEPCLTLSRLLELPDHASCRAMFITQPPVAEVIVMQLASVYRQDIVKNMAGVTLGDVVDALLEDAFLECLDVVQIRVPGAKMFRIEDLDTVNRLAKEVPLPGKVRQFDELLHSSWASSVSHEEAVDTFNPICNPWTMLPPFMAQSDLLQDAFAPFPAPPSPLTAPPLPLHLLPADWPPEPETGPLWAAAMERYGAATTNNKRRHGEI